MRPISRINKGISINELLSAPIQCEAPLSPQICFQRFVGMKWKSQDFEPNLRSCARCCIIIFPCLSKVMIIFHDTLLSATTVCDCEALVFSFKYKYSVFYHYISFCFVTPLFVLFCFTFLLVPGQNSQSLYICVIFTAF